ncbi:uncharacterized protein LOC127435395 [Myxocyprinus asiaticus]|uniref:uncharacterized protein LOC127435395 n=1 Tax=Myxocyprinus asiaticus TaxID=70543 RepID=UPI002221DA62|nr:uncharacterized protein LOC127435395 [Myxocyprinus asiaticus]
MFSTILNSVYLWQCGWRGRVVIPHTRPLIRLIKPERDKADRRRQCDRESYGQLSDTCVCICLFWFKFIIKILFILSSWFSPPPFPFTCYTGAEIQEGGGMRCSRVLATTIHPNGAAAAIRRGMEEPGRLRAEEWPPTARGGAGGPLPGAGETLSVHRKCGGAFRPPGAGGLPPFRPVRHGCRPLEGGGVAEDQATAYRRTGE